MLIWVHKANQPTTTLGEGSSSSPIFGEAISFYKLESEQKAPQIFVIYYPLQTPFRTHGVWTGTWGRIPKALDIINITTIVGIWQYNSSKEGIVYILERYPALDLLNSEELHIDELGLED